MIPDMTVLENVALGAHTRGHKRRAGGDAAARPRRGAHAVPRGRSASSNASAWATHLHELAGNLAMGPQRLLEIARALCADPALLLLDEPAAGLRHQEKQALAEVLRQLQREGHEHPAGRARHGLGDGRLRPLVVMEFGTLLMEGTPDRGAAKPQGARRLPGHGTLSAA